MAVVSFGHHPELTVEGAMEVFGQQFGHEYRIEMLPNRFREGLGGIKKINPRDFAIGRNGLIGVFVHVEQESQDTQIVFSGGSPSTFWRTLSFFLLGAPFFMYNGMMREVREFLQTPGAFD